MAPRKRLEPEKTPTEVVAEQLRRTRERKGWTQQQLAERLDELGLPIDRSTITKIENGARGVTFDEVIAFAVALNVPPYSLAVPRAVGGMVRLAPGLEVDAREGEGWWRGAHPLLANALDEEDRRFYFDSCSTEEALVRRLLPSLVDVRKGADSAVRLAGLALSASEGERVTENPDKKDLAAAVILAGVVEPILRETRNDLATAIRKVGRMARDLDADAVAELHRIVADMTEERD